jgi:hypothetical protein
MKKICTITDTFQIGKKRGVIFTPLIPIDTFEGMIIPKKVTLKYVNGKEEERTARFSIPRQSNGDVAFFKGSITHKHRYLLIFCTMDSGLGMDITSARHCGRTVSSGRRSWF